MFICRDYYYWQLKHSLRLLRRYQQIGFYFIISPVLLIFPHFIRIEEKYNLLILFSHFILIIWIFSPFYLNQFSFSYDDYRSFSIFPLDWKAIIWGRNTVNILLLILILCSTVLIIRYIYLKDSTYLLPLFIYVIFNILPLVTIGNLLSIKSINRRREYYFSWTSLFVFPIAFSNLLYLYFVYLFFEGIGYFFSILLVLSIYISIYIYSVNILIKKYCIIIPEAGKMKR